MGTRGRNKFQKPDPDRVHRQLEAETHSRRPAPHWRLMSACIGAIFKQGSITRCADDNSTPQRPQR